MINLVKEVAQTKLSNQSLAAPRKLTRSKQRSTPADTIQISEAAKSAMTEAAETHYEVTIKAKCGDLDAQRLLEQEAARKELLGI
jgi:hypothetical protein